MVVRTYKAPTLKEALSRVRSDIGPSALIIETKDYVEKSFLGLRKNAGVEVVAALDDEAEEAPSPSSTPVRGDVGQRHYARTDRVQSGDTFQSLYRDLLLRGVEETLAKQVVAKTMRYDDSGADAKAARRHLGSIIAGQLNISGEIQADRAAAKIVAFVGPTGVGKTTTVAKLAAIHHLARQEKVALVSLDCYRVAAVDQLKCYAEMIGVPIRTAFSPSDLQKVVAELYDAAYIFVDTAGVGPLEQGRLEELDEIFRAQSFVEVHLLISCVTPYEQARQILKSFSLLPISRLIFTKVDETTTPGLIFNLGARTSKALSYLTTGQDVPDDIEAVRPEAVSELFLGKA